MTPGLGDFSQHWEIDVEELPSGKRRVACPICHAKIVRFTENAAMDDLAQHMNIDHDGGRRTGSA